jgi:hypothetical protein
MNKLRQMMQGLGNLDAKFASRAERDMGGAQKHPLRVALGATPFNDMGVARADTVLEKAAGAVAIGGIAATNAGYRYGLPIAGVTLAGKGLFDLSYQVGAHFGSKADQPEEDTLTLQ